ncbi:MAG TPA: YdeI/OmpD-associated family protein [Vicinamibacterales bacterium]|nr:YdeI/OmpD-associated family protein [Vicinamibacterales bacterium]
MPRDPRVKTAKPPVKTPADLAAALKRSPRALGAFKAFPPSHRREYVEWITEAKAADTRARRVVQAVEWIAEGKSRNWKYQR